LLAAAFGELLLAAHQVVGAHSQRVIPLLRVGWLWDCVQQNRSQDMESGAQGHHPLDPSLVQKAVKQAVKYVGFT
jgi:hypothetical protein